jgi:hypothetical protein
MKKTVTFLFAASFWGTLICMQAFYPQAYAQTADVAEHEACSNLEYAYHSHTSQQLRAIAATCHSEPISRLYYNRAYHEDLLQEGETLSQIVALFSRDMRRHIEAYRVYIALIEAFAPSWYADADSRAVFLNKEYDRRGEVTELRLHGYDRLADVKERQISLP